MLKLEGLIAATYTPMRPDGDVDLKQVGGMVQHLHGQEIAGLYVCGSTGEGISMTGAERRQVAKAYVDEADDLPVIVQVGHNSLHEAKELAEHAQAIGADAISANAPSYFKAKDVTTLVNCMATIAAGAPELPFYYYHIPHLTQANVDMLQFMERATEAIPNFAGLKYTAATLHEFLACREWNDAQHTVLWGSDEMLLGALAMGAVGAVGSTYNIIGRLFSKLISAFANSDIAGARETQSLANDYIRTVYQYPFHPASKCILGWQGVECGPCRLPLGSLSEEQKKDLRRDLEALGFFDW